MTDNFKVIGIFSPKTIKNISHGQRSRSNDTMLVKELLFLAASVCLCVCLSAKNWKKLLIRSWCNLRGLCVAVTHRCDWIGAQIVKYRRSPNWFSSIHPGMALAFLTANCWRLGLCTHCNFFYLATLLWSAVLGYAAAMPSVRCV